MSDINSIIPIIYGLNSVFYIMLMIISMLFCLMMFIQRMFQYIFKIEITASNANKIYIIIFNFISFTLGIAFTYFI